MRNAKSEDIEKFKNDHKLKTLGMPEFIAMGSHEIQQMKHRFIVLPRFGVDIWKIFNEQGHKFPLHTVYRLGWQILNALQYIHSCTYVHGDIKGSNILLGFGKGGEEQAYLLDFGLTCHYNTKEFKPDPKKMHNGTIEYTSRDAHQGVPTMRGDIEILAYNLIEYAGAKLPWVVNKLLNQPVEVQKAKEEFMKATDKSLKSCFGSNSVPVPLGNLFKFLGSMKDNTVPDYAKIRGMFEAGIKDLGQKNSGVLQFAGAKTPTMPKKSAYGRPDFSKTKKNDEDDQPGPSGIEPTVKRTRGAKKYVEVDSEDGDYEAVEHQNSPKKKAKAKTTAKSKPVKEVQVDARLGKRNRARQQTAASSESEDEANEPKQSPKKKSRVETSKPTPVKKAAGSPQKKATEKSGSSKNEEGEQDGTEILLKGKSKSSKNKKTYHLNFNLDVSLNSDVVLVVNRKDKKKKDTKKAKEDEKDDLPYSDENEAGQQNRAGVYKGKSAKTK